MEREAFPSDKFMEFDFDDVSDRPGQLLIAKELIETQSGLVRKVLQNILVYRAEFLLMEGVFAYSGYSPMFHRGNNPNRRYQAWFDSAEGTLRFLPDPISISNLNN